MPLLGVANITKARAFGFPKISSLVGRIFHSAPIGPFPISTFAFLIGRSSA
jgi:hypothetical protein